MSSSAYTREWRNVFKARDPEGYRLYRAEEAKKRRANSEKQRDYAKNYRKVYNKNNPDKVRGWATKFRENNPGYFSNKKREENQKHPLRSLVNMAKMRNKKLGLPFDLDHRALELPAVCPVLGIPILRQTDPFHANSPSLDRLVPSCGYTKENTRVISNRANLLKKDGTLEEFRAIVAYLERELG